MCKNKNQQNELTEIVISNSSLPENVVLNSEISSYRQIFKATSIFGGVQVFNILISLVRGKVLAVLIGTAGMGLNGLLMSSLHLIQGASSLGLKESAIRDLSSANHSKNIMQLRYIYTIFKRWIWLTAIIGVVLTISLAPLLSRLTFNDRIHTISFQLLSITFVFGALTGGIYTLLRATRKIKDLARANISGSLAGLLVAIPIFYFYGIEGVVPAIIASSAITYLVSLYFRRNIEIETTKLNLKETISGGKQMVSLGIILTISSLLASATRFILNAFITKTGTIEDLGIFNSGNSIMAGYVGMVFTAMAGDYYPRLSGVINEPKEWKILVNQQAETVLLILGPILTFILFSAPFLIRILLSAEFLPVLDYLVWASIAVILQGLTWVSGFVLIAKGDNKLFLYTQVAGLIWFLSFNILFFDLYGVKGLGISMTINYLLAVVMMFFVLKIKYRFILSAAAYKLTGVNLFLLAVTVAFITLLDYPRAYYFAGITFFISAVISLKGLNSRLNLLQLLRMYFKR